MMKSGALTVPQDTKEVIDLLKFVENAQTVTLVKLNNDIRVI